MPSVSRRGFIKRTSLSIAALGALGAIAPTIPAFADGPLAPRGNAQPAPMPLPTTLIGGEPFMVYVSDPSTGAGTILIGEQAIPFSNGAIVQTLRQAIG